VARVVMFVLNDCRTDARVLREAATLRAAGHRVTIMARTTDPYAASIEREARDGFEIVRVPVATGPLRWVLLARRPRSFARALFGRTSSSTRGRPQRWITGSVLLLVLIAVAPAILVVALVVGGAFLAVGVVPGARAIWLAFRWRLQWRFGIAPWTRGAVAAAPSGDVFHAHDLSGLPAALAARDRQGRRDAAAVVYDSHEIFVEAGANASLPASARTALRDMERGFAREAAALVTVNEAVAGVLGPALDMTDRMVVVRNCVPRWEPPSSEPALLRRSAGIPAGAPLVLSHGSFVAHRGLDQLGTALRLPALAGVHAVLMGRGPLESDLRALAADPELGGRLHVLGPVLPQELPAWIHGADVVVVPIQPSTLNHRLSTPNKLFEALGAGVPVVASDFGPMHRIVVDDPDGPLGTVCDPTDPRAIAVAIRALLDLDEAARTDIRARCLRAAHARYAWEIDAERLLALYRQLAIAPRTADA
jgi:glycosyltransferase involved in cell wall biosynthesis